MAIRVPISQHELASRLQEVLDEALSKHHYVTDLEQFGVQEYWQPGLLGDCEDFALACREMLKAKFGWDSNLIFCKTEQGEGHLVLSKEGWVLDNRFPIVVRRDALPYTWIAAGLPGGSWHRILERRY